MKLVRQYRSKGIDRHTVWIFKEGEREIGINRNHDVGGEQFYIFEAGQLHGEGCETIWYPTLEAAEREVQRLFKTNQKVVTGVDSGLCNECQNSYFYGSEGWKKYGPLRCADFKQKNHSANNSED